jgi:DNA mismatch endonuclease (patch repair protein)
MTDVFTKEKRSEVMSRIRGRGNKQTEVALAGLLRANMITGWRRQVTLKIGSPRRLKVKPDFVFRIEHIALFVDGCFWHACPKHSNIPANNRAFWLKKLAGNKARDRKVNAGLRSAGWHVIRIWEHDLTHKEHTQLVARVKQTLAGARPRSPERRSS